MCLISLPQPASPHRIPSLDGLRALSIFLVIALHSLQRYSIHHPVALGWRALFSGSAGVFIFFEISGFLITTLLLNEYQQGTASLRAFYLRRAFRILPPLYAYIAVVVALGLAGRLAYTRLDIISSLFFFHNFSSTSTAWSLQHLWTISMEEQFYLLWPVILLLALRRSDRRSTEQNIPPPAQPDAGRSAAAIFPTCIILASPLARGLLARSTNPTIHRIGVTNLQFDFLMFGCLLALLQNTARFESIYRAISRVPWLPPAVMLLCNLLSARFQNYFDLTVGFTINGIAIAFFLLWCTRNPTSAVGRILNCKPIVHIGILSYSIYLWQTLFLHHDNAQVFGSSSAVGVWMSTFPCNWIAIYVVASFSYYVIEMPSLALRNRLIAMLGWKSPNSTGRTTR